MTLKTYKKAIRASAFLAAVAMSGGAFAAAAAADSYTFATDEALGSGTYSALNGNGTVVADSYSYSSRAGKPLSGADGNVLEIAGTVTYTNAGESAATTSSQVDFMFKVEATDELENPDGSDIQVALAVGETNAAPNGTTAPIKLWCKTTTDGDAGWAVLKESVTTGSWVRATLVLDYSTTPKRCKVSLDGNPVLNPDATASDQGSEWFYFAGTAAQAFVKSISMVGSTRIDELKVSYDALNSYTPPVPANATIAESGQGSNVTYDYINKYGVTVAEATSPAPLNAESGMSVADKFAAGLDPKSATKFELQTMTTTKSSATVTFPGTKGTGNYTVKVGTTKGGDNVDSKTSTQTDASGEGMNSATLDLTGHENELLYFTVETN